MSSDKTTLKEVLAYAVKEIRAANIRNARIDDQSTTAIYLHVERAWAVEGRLTVDFKMEPSGKKNEYAFRPRVNVNFPASNKDALAAAAFAVLVNELTNLAVSLQVQLDAFKEIVSDTLP